MFDSLLEQFNITLQQRERNISREKLNWFFQNCRKNYSIIERIVNQDVPALKILIRMISVLPLNKENILDSSEAARQFSSIVLRILSEKFSNAWPTIGEAEWLSFNDGLVTLCCLRLLHSQKSVEETDETSHLLSLIPDEVQRRETVLKLLNSLGNWQCTLSKRQQVALYALLDKKELELKHLEVASSLETYISYLTQVMISYHGDAKQLEDDIEKQLNKLLTERRLPSKE